jgi:hypothetical protein
MGRKSRGARDYDHPERSAGGVAQRGVRCRSLHSVRRAIPAARLFQKWTAIAALASHSQR